MYSKRSCSRLRRCRSAVRIRDLRRQRGERVGAERAQHLLKEADARPVGDAHADKLQVAMRAGGSEPRKKGVKVGIPFGAQPVGLVKLHRERRQRCNTIVEATAEDVRVKSHGLRFCPLTRRALRAALNTAVKSRALSADGSVDVPAS
jgi:hypothetical protein